MYLKKASSYVTVILLLLAQLTTAQVNSGIHWSPDGNGVYSIKDGGIEKVDIRTGAKTPVVNKSQLTTSTGKILSPASFAFSDDNAKLLVFTNTAQVWRYRTRGDYWILDMVSHKLTQVGKGRPSQSLMFAKISPDSKWVAYVSGHNLFVEAIGSGAVTQLTFDGTRKLINGTFDWAYEEEFFCRDGFRWSPDSKKIAYWQIDAKNTKDYDMLNTTDSIYPKVIPVEYPVAGEPPSPYKIGVVDIKTAKAKWMSIPTDPILRTYVPRMEWAANASELVIQQLNRKQNESRIMLCNATTGVSKTIYSEKDSAWIDILSLWDQDYSGGGWDWLNGGKEFLWTSEKDGWRHLYRISRDGSNETLITKGKYDVMDITLVDESSGYIYFMASPFNATQKYLYRVKIDGKDTAERVSPAIQQGTHSYKISPGAGFAFHSFSNYYTPPFTEWITLPDHKGVNGENKMNTSVSKEVKENSGVEFFTVKTAEGVEMDAWMKKPQHFDSLKKYPVVFFVYTEPWGQNVKDQYGVTGNSLYQGDMSADGYIYISVDNRGTPVPKGRAWRKSIYRKVGVINISDQAMAAKEIFKRPYIDTGRVAVWGWSGGGSATLNLMFQYPDIYKTGIAIAAVGNQLTYDNIYQERYMGLPQENIEDFIKGSPITYAKNLRGNLLYIHGTGDDNVHYSNAESLLNELIKYNRQFQFMAYPNRTHSISEGEGTTLHLKTLYTNYLKAHCPPGGR